MDLITYAMSRNYVDNQIKKVMNEGKMVGKIYGVYYDKKSSPNLIRTDEAIGMVANVGVDGKYVQNDFDTAEIYREMGSVVDLYNNRFVRIPKFYIRKRNGPDFKSWQISKTKYPGFYLPSCFWDFENERELPYFDFGVHKASLSSDNKLESKPGKYPLISRNIVQFRQYAQANNVDGQTGYQQHDIHAQDVLQTLFYVEFATLNSQSVMQGFSLGRYTATDTAIKTEANANRVVVTSAVAAQFRVGQSISAGTSQGGNQIFYGRTLVAIEDIDASNKALVFDGQPVTITEGNIVYSTAWKTGFGANIAASSGSIGSNTDGKYPCVYRGIESPWADVYEFMDGVNISDNQAWVAKNANDYASNLFAAPYEKLGYINGDTNGYTMKMGYDPDLPFAEFPTQVGGGTTTYYSDYYYQATGARIAHVSGSWANGAIAGVSVVYLTNSSSNAGVLIGGRLHKKAS